MKETTTKYKVTMTIPYLNNRTIDMNSDRNLSIKEAVWRALLYQKKNPDCIFNVVEEVE
jgi:hypothetical protein